MHYTEIFFKCQVLFSNPPFTEGIPLAGGMFYKLVNPLFPFLVIWNLLFNFYSFAFPPIHRLSPLPLRPFPHSPIYYSEFDIRNSIFNFSPSQIFTDSPSHRFYLLSFSIHQTHNPLPPLLYIFLTKNEL